MRDMMQSFWKNMKAFIAILVGAALLVGAIIAYALTKAAG